MSSPWECNSTAHPHTKAATRSDFRPANSAAPDVQRCCPGSTPQPPNQTAAANTPIPYTRPPKSHSSPPLPKASRNNTEDPDPAAAYSIVPPLLPPPRPASSV